MTLYFPVNSTKITSYFGTRNTGIVGASTNHEGIDIGVPTNTAVSAANSGIISAVGYNSTSGNYIKITSSNGLTTFYGHLSKTQVTQGQTVNAGDVIGYSGNTGVSSGAHLHFGVYENGTAVDPLSYSYRNSTLGAENAETDAEDNESDTNVYLAIAIGAAVILAIFLN